MMGWLRHLRWRLLAATCVAITLALLVTGFFLAGLFRQHVTRQFDAQLLHQLDQLTAAFEQDAQGQPTLKTPLSDPRWQAPYSGLYWQIEPVNNPAAALLRSRSLWDAALQVPPDQPGHGEVHRHLSSGPGGQPVRVLERTVHFQNPALPAGGQVPAWRMLVAAHTGELEAAVDSFTGQLALYLAVLGAALLAAAWAQVSLGLMPLRQLQASAQAVRRGDAQRLQGNFPAEVDPLVQDFNRVLEQNQQVVQRARQMAGNLAHAIKTPLAVLSSLAQECKSAEPAVQARKLQEQVDTIRQQVDWHLGRARAASAGVPGLRTPVLPVLEGLARVMSKVHALREDRRAPAIQLVCADAALAFAGEAQDLQEMTGNLLDNACKWARSQVRVEAVLAEGRLAITIDDDGPGLDQAQRDAVFQRGFRADERVPGSGLGLDIAREVARLYQGELTLGTSPLGGLRAVLALPAG
ncbi:ATP-binding protein [Hydrogenophaga aquatica]